MSYVVISPTLPAARALSVPSYQFDVSHFHTFPYISPPQHPDVSTVKLHALHSLLALHINVPSVSQDATEHCIILVRSVDHTDPTRGIVEFSKTCRERGEESCVVML